MSKIRGIQFITCRKRNISHANLSQDSGTTARCNNGGKGGDDHAQGGWDQERGAVGRDERGEREIARETQGHKRVHASPAAMGARSASARGRGRSI